MSEPEHVHPMCSHCRHELTNVVEMNVTLRIKYPRHHQTPTQQDIVKQLKDVLPKEWWWGDNMADWGLSEIR